MKKFLPILILIAALAVSGSAAFYSVYGLGKLFAGASLQVMIMAASLEFAKLVIATALHRYWVSMNKLMRAYLVVAIVALIGITSAGIYGFLSSAYQVTAARDSITTKEIGILELKKERFDEQRLESRQEKQQIVNNITNLRESLSNPNQVQYVDSKTGQLITTTSSSARKSLEVQLNKAVDRRDKLSQKIEAVTDSLATMDIKIVEAEASSEATSELGPLKYVAGLTGKSMDVVVNWFLFLLIFVFDPLAVTLIVLANFAFEKVFGAHAWDVVSSGGDEKKYVNVTVIDSEDSNKQEVGDDVVVVDQEEEPPIIVRDDKKPVRTILDSNLGGDVKKHIKEAMPWINYDSGSEQVPHLSDAAKKNMSWQEIEKWYKNNSV